MMEGKLNCTVECPAPRAPAYRPFVVIGGGEAAK